MNCAQGTATFLRLRHTALHCNLQAEQEEDDDGRTMPKVRRTQVVLEDAKAKARHAGQQAQLDGKNSLSDAEMAAARRTLVASMLPRETVMQTLTRLSARPKQAQVCGGTACSPGGHAA